MFSTIVAIPPIFVSVSKSAAEWLEIGGMLLAANFGICAVLWDFFIVGRRGRRIRASRNVAGRL